MQKHTHTPTHPHTHTSTRFHTLPKHPTTSDFRMACVPAAMIHAHFHTVALGVAQGLHLAAVALLRHLALVLLALQMQPEVSLLAGP